MPATNSVQISAIHLELTAELENLPRFMAFALEWILPLAFSPKRVIEFELVIEEALVNVMDYAYPDQEGLLKLVLKPEPESGLRLEIRDRGNAFNPLERDDPDLEAGLMERPIGGLGIFLMKELADKIFWQRKNDENCLTIIFEQHHD